MSCCDTTHKHALANGCHTVSEMQVGRASRAIARVTGPVHHHRRRPTATDLQPESTADLPHMQFGSAVACSKPRFSRGLSSPFCSCTASSESFCFGVRAIEALESWKHGRSRVSNAQVVTRHRRTVPTRWISAGNISGRGNITQHTDILSRQWGLPRGSDGHRDRAL